jgi:transposase
MKKIAYVGVDYHINVLAIAVVIEEMKDIYETIRLKNQDKLISKYLKKLSAIFELRICYEASSSGYAFQRKVTSWGYHCDVIAPSLIPKKAGNRRKNDFRDAKDLAQNYAAGMLTVVHPPTEEEESIRNFIRARIAFKEDEKRVKQRINSFLMSRDIRWSHSRWTKAHRDWLGNLQMPDRYLQEVLNEHLGHLDYLESRLHYLDAQIEQIACSQIYAPSVTKLRALKGIGTLTAMILIAEITDFRRFPNPRTLMAFLGLIPSENSSADKQKGGGGITRAGNPRCRKCLVEAVQQYPRSPHITRQMKDTLLQVDANSANIAIKCLKRLHKRYWALTMKGKIRSVAITAIARELAGFIWAMMQPQPVEA